MTQSKKPRGRPAKLTAQLQDRLVEAISRGCTYKQAAISCGIADQTLYKWLRLGRTSQDAKCKRLAVAVAKAENDRLVSLLDIVTGHAAKDWRAGAFLLERRYGFTKDANNHDVPEEAATVDIPDTLEELLKKQIVDISHAMGKAQEKESYQAFAALQRQLVTVITQLKAIQDESDDYNEMNEMTDEQILSLVEQSFLSLPPVLRQRAIDKLTR